MFCALVNDFKKMSAFISNPAAIQKDKDHGCVYKVYSVEKMQGQPIGWKISSATPTSFKTAQASLSILAVGLVMHG